MQWNLFQRCNILELTHESTMNSASSSMHEKHRGGKARGEITVHSGWSLPIMGGYFINSSKFLYRRLYHLGIGSS